MQQQIRESLVGRAKNLGTGGMEVGEEIDGHIVLDVLPLVGMLESSVTGARRKVFAERKRSSIKRVLLALSTRMIPLQVRAGAGACAAALAGALSPATAVRLLPPTRPNALPLVTRLSR